MFAIAMNSPVVTQSVQGPRIVHRCEDSRALPCAVTNTLKERQKPCRDIMAHC